MAEIHGLDIVRNGLVLYLDAANPQSFDGNSTIWRDLSGNHIDSSLSNTIEYDNSGLGCLVFDGTNSGSFTILSSLLSNINTITLSSWIYSYDIFSDRQICSKGYGYQYRFSVLSGGYLWVYDINGGQLKTSSQVIDTDTWYFVTTTLGPSGRKLYVNDTLVGSNNVVYNPSSSFADTTSHFIGFVNSGGERWCGNIGISMRYNKVLTQSEITQNFNATKSRYGL